MLVKRRDRHTEIIWMAVKSLKDEHKEMQTDFFFARLLAEEKPPPSNLVLP